MKKIAGATMITMMIIPWTAFSAQAQSQDPKAEQKRTAKDIDAQYERARKGSSWAVTPKSVNDPWLSVRPTPTPPPGDKK